MLISLLVISTLYSQIYTPKKTVLNVTSDLGNIIHNITTGEYRYHYISSNNLLFQHAITITNHQDIDKFMTKIFDLDLGMNYYLRRPGSAWNL